MSTTPMMQQYQDAKAACPDALLLFRMGDFYEMFDDDAKTAARVLGLALTSRDKGENAMPMAGFPAPSARSYLAKLDRGRACARRSAIRWKTRKQAKGLVRREVTRVVTPGTLTDDALLDPQTSNYLAAVVARRDGRAGLGRALDGPVLRRMLSAGTDRRSSWPGSTRPNVCWPKRPTLPLADAASGKRMLVTRRPAWAFAANAATEIAHSSILARPASKASASTTSAMSRRSARPARFSTISARRKRARWPTSIGSFRIAAARRWNSTKRPAAAWSSRARSATAAAKARCLAVIDRTVTPMGARLLADWLANPLTDLGAIDERLDAVAELVGDAASDRRPSRDSCAAFTTWSGCWPA